MQKHRHYLEAKFQSKAEQIVAHYKQGGTVVNCRFCGFDAMLVRSVEGAISTAKCLVCPNGKTIITLNCSDEDCGKKVVFDSYAGPPERCPSCQADFADCIHEQLDTSEFVTSDNMYDQIEINCPNCQGYHSVVEHHNHYICLSCLEYSNEIGVCEWCGEGQLGGVSDMSFLSGCNFCDGRAGWDKDD